MEILFPTLKFTCDKISKVLTEIFKEDANEVNQILSKDVSFFKDHKLISPLSLNKSRDIQPTIIVTIKIFVIDKNDFI